MNETAVQPPENQPPVVISRRKQIMQKVMTIVLTIVLLFALAVASVYLFINSYYTPVWVDGVSMQPTLINKEFGLMNGHKNRINSIKRSEIIIAYVDLNGDNQIESDPVIKRVIGLPGETIRITDGGVDTDGFSLPDKVTITRNGVAFVYEEKIGTKYQASTYYSHANYATHSDFVLDFDQYFVMGDNRSNSTDSRIFGAVRKANIAGVLYCINGRADDVQVSIDGNGIRTTEFINRRYYALNKIRYFYV